MKAVVLGASGYLGGMIYEKLKMDSSFDVIGVCNRTKADSALIHLDVKNVNAVNGFINRYKPDTIIWSVLDIENERSLIDDGLNNVLKYLDDDKRFVFVSTDAFAKGQGNYDEDTEQVYYDNKNPLSGYANAKIDGEKMVIKKMRNCVIIRTGPIYGQDVYGNWSQKRSKDLEEKLKRNEQVQFADNLCKTFVHVDDLSSAIVELAKSDYRGIIHAGPHTKESYYTFYKKLAVQMGLDDKLISSYTIDESDAVLKGLPLDTSMNTELFRRLFKTKFRNVQ